ncbi:holo-ACP synthase [Paraglaciecola aestuariivivens]
MAIKGLGTDIVEIARIAKQLSRSQKLAERVLTQNEWQSFIQHNFPERFLAKRFAAKEAAVKALGTGIGQGISFQQVEVVNLESGQPTLVFSGKFAQLCESLQINGSFISISDEQHYAMATVVLTSE